MKTNAFYTEIDFDLLRNVALAYEMAASEKSQHLSNSLLNAPGEDSMVAHAAAFKAFDIWRALPLPGSSAEQINHILHFCALGYCADRGTDVRRWLREHSLELDGVRSFSSDEWIALLTETLFHCWIKLFRKSGWQDLNEISPSIILLRELQKKFEADYLAKSSDNARNLALNLVSLYHWAKATESLAIYTLQGRPRKIRSELDMHFESAQQAAEGIGDHERWTLLQWLKLSAKRMISNSVWSVSHAVDPKMHQFVESVTRTRGLFELLPPQQSAIYKQGLLDPVAKAIVIDLPTSGGKTMLAQFRILQALNQFEGDDGWVAYVAPSRALVSQLTKKLRKDFEPLGFAVEQLSTSMSLDAFELNLLTIENAKKSFHILVSTPEKLQMVLRRRSSKRPLALLVMDEAQNIEDKDRGLRIELLLATVKKECEHANIILLMPYVPNSRDLAEWLEPEFGKTISLSTSAWQPNERIVGVFRTNDQSSGNWSMEFEVLETGPKTMAFSGTYVIPGPRPLPVPYSKLSQSLETAAIAKHFSSKGTSIAIARTVRDCWTMARELAQSLPELDPMPDEITLVRKFLSSEFGKEFELYQLLRKGIAVHHAGLSDETRALIEWLAEEGKLIVLCATTTIIEGINFPVSSIFLSSLYRGGTAESKPISERDFWNLAGRAGRVDQGSVGVIGIAAGQHEDEIRDFVKKQAKALRSRLLTLLDDVEARGKLDELDGAIQSPEWDDFRTFLAHLVNNDERNHLIDDAENVLRNTFGFDELKRRDDDHSRRRADALVKATRNYVRKIRPLEASLVDATGFSPEAIRDAIGLMNQMDRKLTADDWVPENLFGTNERSALNMLVGVMRQIPQLSRLRDIGGSRQPKVERIASDWVSGVSLKDIAAQHFQTDSMSKTEAITSACNGVFRSIAIFGTWGLSALSRMPNSGINYDELNPAEREEINQIPAMLYHGVKTRQGVLMRLNNVPRAIAEPLGAVYINTHGEAATMLSARQFLSKLPLDVWNGVAQASEMSGQEYRDIWRILSGSSLLAP
ncbi:DEAD/DEAH box helicase [Candidatus Obscuribacterales bacterium]|nr:DEAD/DEAH box helicase [Candidatus Obscuribacterales bacterium]